MAVRTESLVIQDHQKKKQVREKKDPSDILRREKRETEDSLLKEKGLTV